MSSKARSASLKSSTMRAPQCRRRQSVINIALLLLSLAIRSACPFTIVALVSRSRSDSGVRTVQTLDREDVALFAGASRKKTSASAEETTTGSSTSHILSIYEKRWLGRLEELKKYGEKYGTYRVPRNCAEEYKTLQVWVRTQRYHYRLYQDGKPSSMNEERISALEDIGFQWEPSETLWEKNFNELVQYEAAHGHCNVPFEWKENPQLADWVRTQRRQYRLLQAGEKSSMTASRISKLEGIGFSWDVRNALWGKRFDELVQYKEMHGNCDVPQKSKEYPQLALWVYRQREHYRLRKEGKPNHMTNDRIEKLESIGFSWCLRISPGWETRFQELVEYEAEHGHCNVPYGWEENPQLANWVNGQRQAYQDRRKGKTNYMTDDRIEKLESIGFSWRLSIRPAWETRFQELVEYEAEHGHCNVPYRWEENPQLANWVCRQRQQYHLLQQGEKSSMSSDRISKLEDIGFKWRRMKTVSWETRFQELVEYEAEHGHCNVPRNSEEYPQLATWSATQRQQYRRLQEGKKSSMTDDRISKLEGIGFDWHPKRGRKKH